MSNSAAFDERRRVRVRLRPARRLSISAEPEMAAGFIYWIEPYPLLWFCRFSHVQRVQRGGSGPPPGRLRSGSRLTLGGFSFADIRDPSRTSVFVLAMSLWRFDRGGEAIP